METTRIEYFFAWHDNNDRIDFGNGGGDVIATHFKDMRENSEVGINDASTEWDMMKSNFYGRQVEAGQHKYEPYIINYI